MAMEHMLTRRAQAPQTCQVALSYLEVYMDRCYDLLEPKKELQVLDDYTGRVSVPNLAEVTILVLALPYPVVRYKSIHNSAVCTFKLKAYAIYTIPAFYH